MAKEDTLRINIKGDASDANRAFLAVIANSKLLKKITDEQTKSHYAQRDALDFALGRALSRTAARIGDFGRKLLRMNLKGFGIELVAVTASLLLMKASLATGRFIMNAWSSTVSFMTATVAGLTAGIIGLIGVLAAANQEFAQFVMTPHFGNNMVQTVAAMRPSLAVPAVQMMGITNNAAVFNTLGRNAATQGRMPTIIPALARLANGDPRAYLAMAKTLSQSVSQGSSQAFSDTLRGQGSIYGDVADKAAGTPAVDLISALLSGELTPSELKSRGNLLENTLMGTVKGMVTRFYGIFAEIGAPFLEPLREAFVEMEKMMRIALRQITGVLTSVGLTDFIPGLVNQTQRFLDWIVKIIVEDLPRVKQVFRDIMEWWRDFTAGASRFFGDLGDRMHQFEDAATTAWTMVKNVFGEVWDTVKDRMKHWRDLIDDNAAAFTHFGEDMGGAIGGFIEMVTRFAGPFFANIDAWAEFFRFLRDEVFPKLGDFAEEFSNAFSRALPLIQTIVNTLMPLVTALTSVITFLNRMGGVGSLMVLAGGFLGMTGMGRGMSGAFYRGMRTGDISDQYLISSLLGGKLNPRYTARQAARASAATTGRTVGGIGGAGAFHQNAQGLWVPGPAPPATPPKKASGFGIGGKQISGSMIALGALTLASIGMAFAPGNQIAEMGMAMAPGAMLAMIPGGGGVAAAIAAGLLGARHAWDVRGHAAGAVTTGASWGAIGAGVGAAAGMMGGPFAALTVPVGAFIGGTIATAAGSVYGWIRGGKNQEKYEKAGTTQAANRINQMRANMFGTTSMQGIRDELKAYDDLLASPAAMKAEAKQRDVGYDQYVAELQGRRDAFQIEADERTALWISSMDTISKVTGEGADEIETNAHRWGLVLANAADQAEYYYRRNERWGSWMRADGTIRGIDRDYFAATLTGMIATQVEESSFVQGTESQQLRHAQVQSAAATTAFLTQLQTGEFDWSLGSDDSALAQDVLQTALALGSSMGMEGSELSEWALRGFGNFATMAEGRGFDLSGTRVQQQLAYFVKEGEKAFTIDNDVALMNFKDSPIGKAMNEMLMGPMSKTQEEADVYLQTALSSGDPEGALEQLNVLLWSKKAQDAAGQIAAMGNAADRAAAALDAIGGPDPASQAAAARKVRISTPEIYDHNNPDHPAFRSPSVTAP